MLDYRADHYYLFDEMQAYLQGVAAAHPGLVELRSIGKSAEGRDIWLLAITDLASGAFDDKPAYWIDGNTHASEVMGSAACLYTIDYVVKNAGSEEIAQLLQVATLYVVARINPDGAEFCLTHNQYVRSAPRLYPDEARAAGLIVEDVDGNGELLQMRVVSEDGAWRVSVR
ncbi:MAG: carboxypeptidase, partial [Bradymonadaceae bacterium]|nr:carboxypeptidase [Lujinxingiaceae bacterium]